MPYAANDVLSTTAFEGAIEISDLQYQYALEEIANGKRVRIKNGQLEMESRISRIVYSVADGSPTVEEVWSEEPIGENYTDKQRPSDEFQWNVETKEWYNPNDISIEEKRERAVLSRADFKLALLDAGYLQSVKDYVAQTDNDRIVILWEDSTYFERTNPVLLQLLSDGLGYTDEQLDALFGI